jgi:hypothetical protein
MMEQY